MHGGEKRLGDGDAHMMRLVSKLTPISAEPDSPTESGFLLPEFRPSRSRPSFSRLFGKSL